MDTQNNGQPITIQMAAPIRAEPILKYPVKASKILGILSIIFSVTCHVSFCIYFINETHLRSGQLISVIIIPGLFNILFCAGGVLAIKASENPVSQTITPMLVLSCLSIMISILVFIFTWTLIMASTFGISHLFLYTILITIFGVLIFNLYLMAVASSAVCCRNNQAQQTVMYSAPRDMTYPVYDNQPMNPPTYIQAPLNQNLTSTQPGGSGFQTYPEVSNQQLPAKM